MLFQVHSWTRPQLSLTHGRHQEDFDIQPPLEHQYPDGRPFLRRSKKTLGDRRVFSNASAKIWNSLPQSLQSQQNFNAFKSLLKTHYFREAFNFFLQFYIAYIFAFYCKFKTVNRSHSNFGFNFNM